MKRKPNLVSDFLLSLKKKKKEVCGESSSSDDESDIDNKKEGNNKNNNNKEDNNNNNDNNIKKMIKTKEKLTKINNSSLYTEIFLINNETNGSQVKYIENFMTKEESKQLFETLMKICEWERGKLKMFGKEIISKRQMSAFGERDFKPLYDKDNYSKQHRKPLQDIWPKELLDLKEKIEKYTGEIFTFALINRYDDGDHAIAWHSDVEEDIKEGSSIVSISLGAARDFQFRPIPNIKEKKELNKKKEKTEEEEKEEDKKEEKETKKKRKKNTEIITKCLENGSMVIMNAATQKYYQHCVPVRKKVLSTRLNVTFRHVVRKK
ncbi:hypothetical protein ABK040_016552 [Willaertia magna]